MTGRFWKINSQGDLQNDSNWQYVDKTYYQPVDQIKNAILSEFKDKIEGLYLTGSVSRGLAILNKSDLDLFMVIKPDYSFNEKDRSTLAEIEHAIHNQYRFITDVQIEAWPWDYVFLPNNEFSIGAFIIKTHSIFLLGNDVSSKIEPYTLTWHIANDDVIQIKPDIEEAIFEINRDPSEQNVAYWCKRIMKNVTRACFGLVMLDLGEFTRDVDLCVDSFLKQYPNKRQDIRTVKRLINEPTGNKEAVLEVLNSFGKWVITEAENWLKVYHS